MNNNNNITLEREFIRECDSLFEGELNFIQYVLTLRIVSTSDPEYQTWIDNFAKLSEEEKSDIRYRLISAL